MDGFWALAEQGGVSQAECAQLKNLGWDNYGITAKAGDALRTLLIQRIGMAPSDITDKFVSLVVTSYATGPRRDLGEGGDGPGSVWNFLVCLAIDLGGKGMPMTGMHFKEGKFFEGYMKCVNKTTAKSLGKQVATHMVVLLSNAFFQSPMCMVEVHHACHSGIKLVLVAIEELDWPNIREKAWPLDTSRTRFPFSGGPVKWGDAEFASNRAAVLAEVMGGNCYPRPDSVTVTWAENGGFDVLSWIVREVGGSLEGGGQPPPPPPTSPSPSLSVFRTLQIQQKRKLRREEDGNLQGDAAVLFAIRCDNAHIGASRTGWKDLTPASDLSKLDLQGVTVNGSGKITRLDFSGWVLTGERLLCSTSATFD
jgi:hypothetical protein